MKNKLTLIGLLFIFTLLQACGKAGAPQPIPYEPPQKSQANLQP